MDTSFFAQQVFHSATRLFNAIQSFDYADHSFLPEVNHSMMRYLQLNVLSLKETSVDYLLEPLSVKPQHVLSQRNSSKFIHGVLFIVVIDALTVDPTFHGEAHAVHACEKNLRWKERSSESLVMACGMHGASVDYARIWKPCWNNFAELH